MDIDFKSLKRDDEYLADLGGNVWLMDNHKWALYVWERFRLQVGGGKKFTLAHADYHWDGGYDVHALPTAEQELLCADLDQLRALIAEEKWVKYDSFIAPAVAREMFDAVHFYCKQNNGWDVGIAEDIRKASATEQIIHESPESFASLNHLPLLFFDLCLDLFNKSDVFENGDLWSDDEIFSFLDTIRPLITKASIVTISLSFEYSGTAEDTQYLASLVLPRIQAWRGPLKS
jgi:hypothetical protein